MLESEARGLTHWIVYSDESSVYAYDIVTGKGNAQAILVDLPSQVDTIAVDSNKGYMFLGYNSEDEVARVDRYDFAVDNTDK